MADISRRAGIHAFFILSIKLVIVFLNPQGSYQPHKSSLIECSPWGAVGKGFWDIWSGGGSNLLPLAQRSKQAVFHLCCSLRKDLGGS